MAAASGTAWPVAPAAATHAEPRRRCSAPAIINTLAAWRGAPACLAHRGCCLLDVPAPRHGRLTADNAAEVGHDQQEKAVTHK